MKRKSHKSKRAKRRPKKGSSRKLLQQNRRNHKRKRETRKKPVLAKRKQRVADPRIARALGLMRRGGVSASKAAQQERIKLNTFRKGAGRFLYRSGPGKPWKARSEDQLRFSMTVLTRKGRVDVIVRNSRGRKLLHEYESALRMFRAAEDGAEEELKKFAGKTVGGHKLIVDIRVLIELEEADELDFESLYMPFGGKS